MSHGTLSGDLKPVRDTTEGNPAIAPLCSSSLLCSIVSVCLSVCLSCCTSSHTMRLVCWLACSLLARAESGVGWCSKSAEQSRADNTPTMCYRPGRSLSFSLATDPVACQPCDDETCRDAHGVCAASYIPLPLRPFLLSSSPLPSLSSLPRDDPRLQYYIQNRNLFQGTGTEMG